jgi:hypothetical protein
VRRDERSGTGETVCRVQRGSLLDGNDRYHTRATALRPRTFQGDLVTRSA